MVNKELYNKICKALSEMPPETGGILGSRKGKLTAFYFDDGGSCSEKCYIPDVDLLNRKIREWCTQGMDFEGIVHSHWSNNALSAQDIRYGRQIARAFGRKILMGIYVYNIGKLYLYEVHPEEGETRPVQIDYRRL